MSLRGIGRVVKGRMTKGRMMSLDTVATKDVTRHRQLGIPVGRPVDVSSFGKRIKDFAKAQLPYPVKTHPGERESLFGPHPHEHIVADPEYRQQEKAERAYRRGAAFAAESPDAKYETDGTPKKRTRFGPRDLK